MENKDRNIQNAAPRRWTGRVLLDALAEGILGLVVFVLRFVGWSLRWTLATIAMFAIMAVAGYYVFDRAVTGGDYVTVPNISGLPLTEALFRLSRTGLAVGDQTPTYSEDVPKGQVISQRPAAGKVVRAGRKILVVISGGPNLVPAPEVTGQTVEGARAILEKAMFKAGNIAYLRNSAPANTVIAQDPPAGHNMSRDGTLNLLVSSGPEPQSIIMPNLVGKPFQEVTRMLAELGIDAVPNRVDTPDAAPDVVLAQRPEAGTPLDQTQAVSFDVRPSNPELLPHARRKVEIAYTPSGEDVGKLLRIDYVDRDGMRQTIYQGIAQGNSDGSGGRLYRMPLAFFDALTVEVYIDDVKTRTYTYTAQGEPVVTEGPDSPGVPAPSVSPDGSADSMAFASPSGAQPLPSTTVTNTPQQGEANGATPEDSALDLGE